MPMLKVIKNIHDRITIVKSINETDKLYERLLTEKSAVILSFVNAHAMNLACTSAEFSDNLRASDYLLRDGVGIKVLMCLLHEDAGRNMNGTDVIPELIKVMGNRSICLYGTEEPWLTMAKRAIPTEMEILDAIDGFQREECYLNSAKCHQPGVILLGMGMPRQEHVANQLKSVLTGSCLIINGGAVIDFMAGRFPRAPDWMRSLGLEWLYRLLREPRRLCGRYVLGIPVFIIRAVLYGVSLRVRKRNNI